MKYWNMGSLMRTTALPETTLKLTWDWQVVYDESWTHEFLEWILDGARKKYQEQVGDCIGKSKSSALAQELLSDDSRLAHTPLEVFIWDIDVLTMDDGKSSIPPESITQTTSLDTVWNIWIPGKNTLPGPSYLPPSTTRNPPSVQLTFSLEEKQKITWILLIIEDCLQKIIDAWFMYHLLISTKGKASTRPPWDTYKINLASTFPTDFFNRYKNIVLKYNVLKSRKYLKAYCSKHGVNNPFVHEPLARFIFSNDLLCTLTDNDACLQVTLPPDLYDWLREFPFSSFIHTLEHWENIHDPENIYYNHWCKKHFMWLPIWDKIKSVIFWWESHICNSLQDIPVFFSPYFHGGSTSQYSKKVILYLNELMFDSFRRTCINWMTE